jgi:RNA polymerase sigma-70 factor (ECF subfamily)
MTKPANYTDLRLVDLAREGDQEAFGALAQRHWGECVGIACNVLRDRDEAEDQAQNAILKAYQHLDQLQSRDENGFAKWLGRIVVNECRMLMRSRHRERFVFLDKVDSFPQKVRLQLRSRDLNPESALAYRQLSHVLEAELKRMPPLIRDVMSLRYLQGLFPKRVAEALGIDIKASKSRLARARQTLRECMSCHVSREGNSSKVHRVGAKDATG